MPEYGRVLFDRIAWVNASDLPSKHKHLLLVLASHDGPNGVFPSLSLLERETSLSRSSIIRVLANLESLNLVERRRRVVENSQEPTSTMYELKIPAIGSVTVNLPNAGSVTQTLQVVSPRPYGSVTLTPELLKVTTKPEQLTPAPPPPASPPPPDAGGYVSSEVRAPEVGEEAPEQPQATLPGLPPDPEPKARRRGARAPAKAKSKTGANGAEKRPIPDTPHARVVDAYFIAFESARGDKPAFGAIQGRAIRSLVDTVGEDRAIECIQSVYSGWWKDKVSIVDIARDPDKYCGAPKSKSKDSSPFADIPLTDPTKFRMT